MKGTLVGYDGHTIYRVHLKDQKKVIRVKYLRIFEDYGSKSSTELPDYSEGTPTFQGFFFVDNDNEKVGDDMHLTHASSRKVLDVEKAKQAPPEEELHSTRASGRKVLDAEKAKQSSPPRKRSRKVNDAEAIPSKVTTSSRGQRSTTLIPTL